LSGVTAAVVGVILNLSAWFGLHVFFGTVDKVGAGPLTLWMPNVTTLDWAALALAAISALALFRFHLSLAWTLTLAAGFALAWHTLL
jgi:chromate transporter